MIYHPILNSGTVHLCPMSLQEIFPPLMHGSYLISEFFEYIIWRKFLILSLDTINSCRTVALNGKKVLLIATVLQLLLYTAFECYIVYLWNHIESIIKKCSIQHFILFYCILTFTINLFLWFPFSESATSRHQQYKIYEKKFLVQGRN